MPNKVEIIHVFIDTNVFLRFYSATNDSLLELQKLVELIKNKKLKLWMTQQVSDEFYRRRDQYLRDAVGNLEKHPASASLPRFVQHLPEAVKFSKAVADAGKARKELVDIITKQIVERTLLADSLFAALREVATIVAHTDADFKLAVRRREQGNPPGKRDSLGDQINWETLLRVAPDDQKLCIISRDGDYSSAFGASYVNSFILQEWKDRKKASLKLFIEIREFTKVHFPNINLPKDVTKFAAIDAFKEAGTFAATHIAVKKLNDVYPELTDDEKIKLLEVAMENTQITSIGTDEDVQDLINRLHTDVWADTTPDFDKKIALHFKTTPAAF